LVNNHDYPGLQRGFRLFQTLRVTCAVPALMMAERYPLCHLKHREIRPGKDFSSDHCMCLHERKLYRGQWPLFQQNGIRDTDLADIMHGACNTDIRDKIRIRPQSVSESRRKNSDSGDMLSGIFVTKFRGIGKPRNSLLAHAAQLSESFRKLLGPFCHGHLKFALVILFQLFQMPEPYPLLDCMDKVG